MSAARLSPASIRQTRLLKRARYIAAVKPAGPPPITAQSKSSELNCGAIIIPNSSTHRRCNADVSYTLRTRYVYNRSLDTLQGSTPCRSLWQGAISFGLIYVPVNLFAAAKDNTLPLHLLDSRDFAPVGYHRVNKTTGKEVRSE